MSKNHIVEDNRIITSKKEIWITEKRKKIIAIVSTLLAGKDEEPLSPLKGLLMNYEMSKRMVACMIIKMS